MPSVLAIVSKAVFEKMVDKTVKVGDLVETDQYASNPAAFAQLTPGDAIFLVTVRPPKEALWLVAILEAPRLRGNAWVGKPNQTRIRDITPLLKKLRFTTGKGITARPGALGMSLQTPRLLTDEDVAQLRGGVSPAVAEYRKQVDVTPAAHRAKKQAAAVGGDRFVMTNLRQPFEILKQLPKPQRDQLTRLTKSNGAGTPAQCKDDEEWAPMELVDVVEDGRPAYQLYVWPYGAAELFEHDTTTSVGKAIQHGFELEGDDDLELRQALAAAYAKASFAETIDFQLDRVKSPTPPDEKAIAANDKAAVERLRKVLGESTERYRLFEKLTKSQQAAIRNEYPHLAPDGWQLRLESLGLPPYGALARWAGIAPPTTWERNAGTWPVWKWLKSAAHDEAAVDDAAGAVAKVLTIDEVNDLVWSLIGNSDDLLVHYNMWGESLDHEFGETTASLYTGRLLRVLGALLDAAGDDVALDFATRAVAQKRKRDFFALSTVASFALARRAQRRKEPFPREFYKLAKDADNLCYGTKLDRSFREVVETIAEKDREKFLDDFGFHLTITYNEDRRKGRLVEVPALIHAWTFIDVVRTPKVMKKVVETVAETNEKMPTDQVVEILGGFGPSIAPILEQAIAKKPPNQALLKKALAAVNAS
ncbi:MAG: hypothetical protein H0T46_04480 [Deltaproteobacteria bacterium]|nr:hypothetical protein [Deltaproteobacteria bacterium]